MEHRHHDFECRLLDLGVLLYRDAATVVFYRHAAIFIDHDGYMVAGSRERLIDRVVDDFVDEVMKRLDVRSAHVHTRAPTDGFQTFQDLDVLGGVAANAL